MSEFLEQVVKFGMVGGCVEVSEHPAERLLRLGAGGLEVQEILNVAALIPAEGGAELEQDEPQPADEADLEVQSVCRVSRSCQKCLGSRARSKPWSEAAPLSQSELRRSSSATFAAASFTSAGSG